MGFVDFILSKNMNSQFLEEALKVVQDIPKLINMVSKRVRELNAGSTPMVEVLPRMGMADIALKEISTHQLKFREAPSDSLLEI